MGWGCPQRLMNETYDNIIPIEYVNCFNFVCLYFEYLVLLLTLLSLLRIELWLWLSFFRKREILICKELKVDYPGCQRLF